MQQEYMSYLEDLIQEYLPKYFSEEELEELLGAEDIPLTGPNGLRKQLAEIDYEFFARSYFPEYCFLPPCGFHREQYQEMKWIEENSGGIKEIIAAPRESAKSTTWNTIYTTNNIVYKKKNYIVIISDTSTQAEDDLKKVRETLEDNEYILEDFGSLKGDSTWKNDAILTKNDVLVIARGSGKKIRGIKHKWYRPDLIILDDVENDENVNSPEQRRKLMNWFDKVVTKAGSTYTDIIVIGTILHYDSLLNNLLQRPGYRTKKYKAVIKDSDSPLWVEWEKIYTDLSNPNRTDDARAFFEAHKEEMTAGVELIWPEAKDIYYYKEALVNEGIAAYNSEFQNDPVDPSESWVTPDDFHYYDVLPPEEECIFKAAVDPSMGKNDTSDPSAICTMARDKNGYLYVVESDNERRHPDKIIQDLIDKQMRFNYQEVFAEDVQFQALMADNLRKESAKQGVYINVVTQPKPRGDKHTRIKQLQPLIKNGYIKFHRSQKSLIEQLIYLGKYKHDDEADALQMVTALFVMPEKEFEHSLMPNLTGVKMRR